MLRPEEASARLNTFRVPDRHAGLLKQLARLPRPLARLGRTLLLVDDEGKALDYWSNRTPAQADARKQLADLSAADRRKLFAVLFPKLADQVEAAWGLFNVLPYQNDGARRAFRAPGDNAALAS